MKLSVIKAFIDKNTGEPYNRGDIYESTDKDRIEELQDGGFLLSATNTEGKQLENNQDKNDSKSQETDHNEQTDGGK